ncbi:uncharacterized protein LOC128244378 [Mya arenaria]|uniref:uncharacterized protein LOC128244378 n=1 Tax=Mya arenaria TaxID=6604 RepID=UPI0022E89F59|nr:uncharacterized protein LOC128244378 [Mya arenaria]
MPGKGADTVVSLVHHYFHYHGLGEQNAEIHFDNCAGQNKNHTVLWYALWRTMTEFHPDWHFGLWKNRWRKSNAETIGEVGATVTSSSRSGHNIPQLVGDPEKPVKFFYWKLYLQQFFKQMKNISKYHHVVLEGRQTGQALCTVKSQFAASDVFEFALLKNNAVVVPGLPSNVCIKGMDVERQWCLPDTIWEFCRIDIRT